MYDHYEPVAPATQVSAAELDGPQVIWMGTEGQGADTREADPYDVINFLLKKVEDQQTRIGEHEGFAELMNQELDQLKGKLDAKSYELETTQADYDVQLQNALAVEHELEGARARLAELEAAMEAQRVRAAELETAIGAQQAHAAMLESELETHRNRAAERPRIQLPFHTGQKLASLGYDVPAEPVSAPELEREAV